MFKPDESDRRLLRHMQGGDALDLTTIAARSALTPAAANRRIGKLKRHGVIKGFSVEIDWRALGYAVEVSLRVTLDKTRPDAFDTFLTAARAIPEIHEIQTFLGRVDVRLNVLAHDMAHYQEIYRNRILKLPHINDIEALMLVADVKRSESLPL